MPTHDGDERRPLSDVEPNPSSAPKPLASWYAQGLSDGLGDRLLMFDNSGAPSLELLRFHPHLAQTPGFETALRERVQRLGDFRHPAFAQVRSVKRLEPDDDLALVSNCTPGKRLSEVLHRAHGPAFAAALIRQLAPALVLLQQHDPGGSHGALSPDRIVVSPEGRLTIVEHVLGPALDALNLRNTQLGSLGIAVPPTALSSRAHLNVATDWYQLGLVAVATLIGRPVTTSDLPQLETLLEQAGHSKGADGAALSPAIRQWLERALQISGGRIDSGADARSALDELLQKDARPQGPRRIKRAPAAQREPADLDPAPSVTSPATDVAPGDTEPAPPQAPVMAFDSRPATDDAPSDEENWPTEGDQAPVQVRTLFGEQPVAEKKPSYVPPRAEAAFHYPDPIPKARPAAVRRRTISAAVVVLALIAGVEAGIIARLSRAIWLTPQPTIVAEPTASVDGGMPVSSRSSQTGSLQLTVAPDLNWVRVTSAPSAGVVGVKSTTPPTGTIRISSPIELKVLEGSKVLGSVPGAGLNVPAGRHDIELVNVALGYRLRQVLEVEAGQTVSIHVTPPPGSVTIDASPWAEVSIDGQAIGRTPLGPLPLSPGEHLVTFQHPAGGSDRQRITVKSEAKMRVVGVLRP